MKYVFYLYNTCNIIIVYLYFYFAAVDRVKVTAYVVAGSSDPHDLRITLANSVVKTVHLPSTPTSGENMVFEYDFPSSIDTGDIQSMSIFKGSASNTGATFNNYKASFPQDTACRYKLINGKWNSNIQDQVELSLYLPTGADCSY